MFAKKRAGSRYTRTVAALLGGAFQVQSTRGTHRAARRAGVPWPEAPATSSRSGVSATNQHLHGQNNICRGANQQVIKMLDSIAPLDAAIAPL